MRADGRRAGALGGVPGPRRKVTRGAGPGGGGAGRTGRSQPALGPGQAAPPPPEREERQPAARSLHGETPTSPRSFSSPSPWPRGGQAARVGAAPPWSWGCRTSTAPQLSPSVAAGAQGEGGHVGTLRSSCPSLPTACSC